MASVLTPSQLAFSIDKRIADEKARLEKNISSGAKNIWEHVSSKGVWEKNGLHSYVCKMTKELFTKLSPNIDGSLYKLSQKLNDTYPKASFQVYLGQGDAVHISFTVSPDSSTQETESS